MELLSHTGHCTSPNSESQSGINQPLTFSNGNSFITQTQTNFTHLLEKSPGVCNSTHIFQKGNNLTSFTCKDLVCLCDTGLSARSIPEGVSMHCSCLDLLMKHRYLVQMEPQTAVKVHMYLLCHRQNSLHC